MKLLMKINENSRVLMCFKNLSEQESLEIEKWSLSVNPDSLSYFKLPLFAIARGDLCYDFHFGRPSKAVEPKDN